MRPLPPPYTCSLLHTADTNLLAGMCCCPPPSLQDGRDFADVVSPKLPFIFGMAASNRYYLHIIQHLVEGDTGGWCPTNGRLAGRRVGGRVGGQADALSRSLPLYGPRCGSFPTSCLTRCFVGLPAFPAAARAGVNRFMIALLLQFIVAEKKLEAVQVRRGKGGGEGGGG